MFFRKLIVFYFQEKTETELAWLELQKQQFRNKGEDDRMPPLKKKKRAILRRWQVETEEIKRLKGGASLVDIICFKFNIWTERRDDCNYMFYSPHCLGQKTAKVVLFRVKLPPV